MIKPHAHAQETMEEKLPLTHRAPGENHAYLEESHLVQIMSAKSHHFNLFIQQARPKLISSKLRRTLGSGVDFTSKQKRIFFDTRYDHLRG